MTWPTPPPPIIHTRVLRRWIWSFYVEGCKHKWRETPKMVSARAPSLCDGRRGWTRETPSHMFTFSNVVVLRSINCVSIIEENLKIGERWGRGWPQNTSLSIMCYLAERGRSALNVVGINRGEHDKIGQRWGFAPWGGGMAGPLEIRPFSHYSSCRIW